MVQRMREVILRINNRCASFQVETLGPMIILGGRIANFARDAAFLTEKLRRFLQILGDETIVRESPKYRSNNRMALRVLDKLIYHADEVDHQCQIILHPLAKVSKRQMSRGKKKKIGVIAVVLIS